MRKRTGIRNRYRPNRTGKYCQENKARKADIYDRPMLDHPNHPYGIKYPCCSRKAEKDAS